MKRDWKKICIAGILCLTMAFFAACGKKNTEIDTKETVPIEETETGETEKSPNETKPYFEETKADVTVSVPKEIDTMRPILLGICKTMAGGNTYDPTNSTFYWQCLYNTINGASWTHPDISLSDDGSGYLVPKEVMAEYAEAMFAGNSSFPEIPSSVGGIELNVDLDGYLIYSSEGYTGTMEFTDIEENATGYEVTVAFTSRTGNAEARHFILTKGGYGAFPCAVNSVE